MAEEWLTLDGSVSSILFQNSENGYTILKLKVKKEDCTVVGTMPGVTPGEFLEIQGEWIVHPTYGRQFKAQLVDRKLPQGLKEVYRYLAAGTIEGIGKATAKRLVDEFGEEILDILEQDPQRLTKIKGISPKRATKIHESFCKQVGTRRLLSFLALHQLPTSFAPTLAKFYGDMAQTLLENNPYLLTGEEFRLDFARADQLAFALGIPENHPKRLEAGILFILRKSWNGGHTYQPKEVVLEDSAALLDSTLDFISQSMKQLAETGQLVVEKISGLSAVFLPSLYEAEVEVAQRILAMVREEGSPLLSEKKLGTLLKKIQKDQGISYSPQQCQAVELASKQQVMLLTGGPGTGKTTSLKGVLALFEHLGLKTALAAPTGRAAQRLGELCQGEASTIHRLLETGMDPQTGKLVFQRNQDEPISADAVIVDETSMVDMELMAALLSALPSHSRLVLVGDPDQLPSVGPGNVFSDLIGSDLLPMVRLTQIFRQAEESSIVRNAHGVNRGDLPDLAQKDGDFFFFAQKTPQETLETIVDLCRRRLPDHGISPQQIQVLSPTRKRATGTEALNKALQDALNPPSEKKAQRQYGDWMFRVGDRVMQVKNNYDILWRDFESGKSGMGVFNGDIGSVISVDTDEISVAFEGKTVEYSTDMLSQLEPAFAITVHKAQGSEYGAVILAAFDGAPMLLTRRVLYTAITRAKTLFVGVGAPQVIQQMARNYQEIRRFSGLKPRLLEDVAQDNSLDSEGEAP